MFEFGVLARARARTYTCVPSVGIQVFSIFSVLIRRFERLLHFPSIARACCKGTIAKTQIETNHYAGSLVCLFFFFFFLPLLKTA